MRSRICPICDQKIKGNYCKICHRFVTPVTYESDFMLNESRDGNDYFETQLQREKIIRQTGSTDLNDGHKDHPQVNQPKDRRIENMNGRQMRTTQMPSTYSQRGTQPQQNRNYNPSYDSRRTVDHNSEGRQQKQSGGAFIFVIVFIIILVVEFVMSIVSSF
ncbi:MAG: hypothetical protein IJ744_04470 [Lachnospiraceae bacterium]|nr:hypothetical protein [Lachnospiraceae bacterium]